MLKGIQAVLVSSLLLLMVFAPQSNLDEAARLPFAQTLAFWLLFQTVLALSSALRSRGIKGLLSLAEAGLILFACSLSPLAFFLFPALFLGLPALISPVTPGNTKFLSLTAGLLSLLPILFLSTPLAIVHGALTAILTVLALRDDQFGKLLFQYAKRQELLENELAASERQRVQAEQGLHAQDDSARLMERADIAQKLHDSLGHTLTGSIMQLEAASLLIGEEPARAHSIVMRCAETLRSGLDAIRAQLKAFNPDAAVLGQAVLKTMLERFASEHGWQTSFSMEGDPSRLPRSAWTILSANLQETLTNALRHSKGSTLSCQICVLNRIVRATFKDNGTPPLQVLPGMGLNGMEARLAAIGGSLTLDTQSGFSVTMLIPLQGGTGAHTGSDSR